MKTGIVGAGKVGFSLGKLFSLGGIPLSGYFSRSAASAKEAAEFTGSEFFPNLESLVRESGAIFITVPDGAIGSVFNEIARFDIKGKFICHCSGALSAADAFPKIGETGAKGISVHPLFPVSSKLESYKELKNALFCVEGDESAVRCFSELLGKAGISVQEISSADKVRYHQGCVFASNLVCALAKEAEDILVSCGFSPDSARLALAPLMRSNIEHIIEVGAVDALTGPAERCDTATIEKHLNASPEGISKELYRLLTLKLAEMAERRHPERDYSGLKNLLSR